MMQAPTILIVHDDRTVLARLLARFRGTADVSVAATFADAKAILSSTPPTVLITGVRLGQFNGLHLVIRTRIDHPTTASFVLGDKPDEALREEAAAQGAVCLTYPKEEERLVSLVLTALQRVEG